MTRRGFVFAVASLALLVGARADAREPNGARGACIVVTPLEDGGEERDKEARKCNWGAGTTLAEGSTFSIPVTVGDTGPNGTEVDCRATAYVGVINDGPGNPPPAPPSAHVVQASTYMIIYDDADGSVVYNQWIPGEVQESTPFCDGCYKFRARVTALRTIRDFQRNHSYQIECWYKARVRRYVKRGDQIVEGPLSDLLLGYGVTLYGHNP